MVKDYLAYDCTQHGITQKLQSLVIDRCPAFCMCKHRFVHQRFLIESNVMRIEPQHITKSATKRLFFAKRKLYRVYQVDGRHSLTLRIS